MSSSVEASSRDYVKTAASSRPLAAEGIGADASPALNLQAYLGSELQRRHDQIQGADRWSARRSAAFVIIFCSLAWAGIFSIF